jgi:hypothetical protein
MWLRFTDSGEEQPPMCRAGDRVSGHRRDLRRDARFGGAEARDDEEVVKVDSLVC